MQTRKNNFRTVREERVQEEEHYDITNGIYNIRLSWGACEKQSDEESEGKRHEEEKGNRSESVALHFNIKKEFKGKSTIQIIDSLREEARDPRPSERQWASLVDSLIGMKLESDEER